MDYKQLSRVADSKKQYRSGDIYNKNGIKGKVVEVEDKYIKVEYTDEDGDVQIKKIDLTEIKDTKIKDSREDEVAKVTAELDEAGVLDEWDEEDVDYAIGDIFDGDVAVARLSDLENAYLFKTEFKESAVDSLLNNYINFGELDDEEREYAQKLIEEGITKSPFHVVEELYDDNPEGMGFEIKVKPYDTLISAWKEYSWGVD